MREDGPWVARGSEANGRRTSGMGANARGAPGGPAIWLPRARCQAQAAKWGIRRQGRDMDYHDWHGDPVTCTTCGRAGQGKDAALRASSGDGEEHECCIAARQSLPRMALGERSAQRSADRSGRPGRGGMPHEPAGRIRKNLAALARRVARPGIGPGCTRTGCDGTCYLQRPGRDPCRRSRRRVRRRTVQAFRRDEKVVCPGLSRAGASGAAENCPWHHFFG